MIQNKIVLLDAGHGVETPGKRSPLWADGTQLFEYEFNRDIVKRVSVLLDSAGIKYRTIVPEDEDITLGTRCRRINRINRELGGRCFLVSVHANAGGGHGFEIYTTRGVTFSDHIADVYGEEARKAFPDRKMRADYADGDFDKEIDFYILKHTVCPAVLTENFFMDSEDECRWLMSNEGRERIAEMHFAAIKRLVYE